MTSDWKQTLARPVHDSSVAGSLREAVARFWLINVGCPRATGGQIPASGAPLPPLDARRQSSLRSGFTLVELLIVLALIATLLTIALPRYFGSLERSKEAALKQTLAATRDAIDKFFADNGKYPESLPELVDKRYLRSLPLDPITESTTTWTIVSAPQESAARGEVRGEVYDVKSGAEGNASDGKPYAEF